MKAPIEDIKQALKADEGRIFVNETRREVSIMTQDSKDWNRARNGGEYAYYRTYGVDAQGVYAFDDWSADFDRREWLGVGDQYPQALTFEGLRKLVNRLALKD